MVQTAVLIAQRLCTAPTDYSKVGELYIKTTPTNEDFSSLSQRLASRARHGQRHFLVACAARRRCRCAEASSMGRAAFVRPTFHANDATLGPRKLAT